MNRYIFVAAGSLVAFVLVVSGCGRNECNRKDAECRDGEAWVCTWDSTNDLPWGGRYTWRRSRCDEDEHCIRLDSVEQPSTFDNRREGFAFCALDPEVDPSVPESLLDDAWVDRCRGGDTIVTWINGYRIEEETCPDGNDCLDVDDHPAIAECRSETICTPDTEPHPPCGEQLEAGCTEDNEIFACKCGFRNDVESCEDRESGSQCVPIESQSGALPIATCR